MTTPGGGEGEGPILPMYDNSGELPPAAPGDLSNPLLASYRHMLSIGPSEERAYSPLIPITVQEQQQQQQQQPPQQQQAPSPTSRDARVSPGYGKSPIHSLLGLPDADLDSVKVLECNY